jgi:hypothetical protein
MKDVEHFFEEYKKARYDVYLADCEQRRILRLHFLTNPEGKKYERQTIGNLLTEKITAAREVGGRVEIKTDGCDTTGPRTYLLRKSGKEWRIEKLFLSCPACKAVVMKSCTMCGGTGLWEVHDP